MLEYFYEARHSLIQLRSGASGPYIDGFAGKLRDEGYSTECGQRLIRSAVHFGHFFDQRGLSLDAAEEKMLSEFRAHEPCTCLYYRAGKTEKDCRGARSFLGYLQEVGIVKKVEPTRPRWVESFEHWLRQSLGLKESSLHRYGKRAALFMQSLGEDPRQYHAHQVRRFILRYSRTHGRDATGNLCTAARAFLRFLSAQGECQAGLEQAVPILTGWTPSAPPPHLSSTEVERVIAGCDTHSAIGVRNRAIVLFLARLALRASDVSALHLDDIDWSGGSFVVSGKTSRQVRLPLPQEVGDAVLTYLPHRPPAPTDALFVRHKAPLGSLQAVSVSSIAKDALRKAGIQIHPCGAHLLRHTAATQMLRQGVPLSQIGTILRHRSQDMTAHYARVDFDLLNEVVQPWPEAPSCS